MLRGTVWPGGFGKPAARLRGGGRPRAAPNPMIGQSLSAGIRPQPLATKILPPRGAGGLIDRPRLLGLLAQVEAKQLTVVKSGGGFGKTSLASAWAEQLRQNNKAVAWLTLDAEDDEPRQFLLYVARALRRACPGVGDAVASLISEISLVPPVSLVSMLINELTDIADDVFLILDDYHWISDPQIHKLVQFLLAHAPAHFHLVITSRTEPAIARGRLRAQNNLLEIDASALRFDLEETRAFLEHENFGPTDPADVNILYQKTEGWPAVLRIVASTCNQTGEPLGQYARRLSGTLRPIGAYLAEMLDGLPADMLLFMLRVSLLDRLTPPLCEAVAPLCETGVAASRDMLSSMADRQLLLTPLDQEGQWYRYHPLLGAHLSARLQRERGQELPTLHHRAAQWYAAHELWTDAVRHAIAAGDTDETMAWIERSAMTLVKQGDLLTLLDWQRRFPGALTRSQGEMKLAAAWGLALAMRFEEARALLAELEQGPGAEETPKAEVLRCDCQTVRSVVAALADDSQAALPLAQACLERASDPWTLNVAANVVRFCHWKADDLKGFYATPWRSCSADEGRRNLFAAVYRLCFQGLVEVQQLRLPAGERHYLEALQLAEQHAGPNSVAAAFPASLIGELRYEQGRLDEAEAAVIDRLAVINATGMLECTLRTYVVLARVAAWRGHRERAYALLEQAEHLGHARKWGRLVAAVLLERLRLDVAEGKFLEAGACLHQLEDLAAAYPAPVRCAWSAIGTYAQLARASLGLAQGDWQDSIGTLKKLSQEARAANHNYRELGLAARLAVAHLRANDVAAAAEVFRDLLTAAAGRGIFQTILDQGPEIGPLLSHFQKQAQPGRQSEEVLSCAAGLLARWRELYPPRAAAAAVPVAADLLSPRERNILGLIGQGQTNKAIARALGIKPETVKTHVKRIFIKLGVDSRAQAVARVQNFRQLAQA